MGCLQTLTNITTDCGSNLGGVSVVYIANRDDVKEVTITENKISAITMETSKYFNTFEFRKQTANLKSDYTIDDTAGVKYVTSNLSLRFAKQDTAKRVAITALVQGEFVAIVKDNNGAYWYLGKDSTVTATQGGSDTGTAFGDANEYTITLTDMSKEYPYEVDESIINGLLAPGA